MKIILITFVFLLHHSLISCRTVAHSELDSPSEDMDSPTEDIANLLIPLIEKTLEKSSNQRARKLIQMLPYNESVEASRWSKFNKKRVVEIMPLRRKQSRGEKPLAYLLAAPHSDTESRETQRGVRKHETEDIDFGEDEYEDSKDDSDGGSADTKSTEHIRRRAHVDLILRNHETRESKESNERAGSNESSRSERSDSSDSSSEEPDSLVEEALHHDDEAASKENDNKDGGNESDYIDNSTQEKNSNDREELKEHVQVSESEESDGNSASDDDDNDIREGARENENEIEDTVILIQSDERNSNKSEERDQITDDSNERQYWGTDDVSFGVVEDTSDDSNQSKLNTNRRSDCKRVMRARHSDESEGDTRHEHKSYRLSFLFNR